MARSVADAAIILGTLTGIDPRDLLTASSQGNSLTDYAQALDPDGLSGARIGVARDRAGFGDRVDKLFEEALDVMRQQGATIVDPIKLPAELTFGNDYEMEVLSYEFKADLNAYLASLGPDAPVKSLKEVIEHNERNAELELSLFGQDLLTGSEERGPLSDSRYVEALGHSHRLLRAEGIDRVMVSERLDAIVGPTGGPAALLDPLGARLGSDGSCSTPSAMAGYPNMTLPMGFIFGLPVGISLFGRAWTESTLIRLAYGYEQATKHRQPPKFLPTIDVTA
jgi:amidase